VPRATVVLHCVRPWCVLRASMVLRATMVLLHVWVRSNVPSAVERTLEEPLLYFKSTLPFASHDLMQCPAQHKILKTLKIIRY
jgi:hypothetical protein